MWKRNGYWKEYIIRGKGILITVFEGIVEGEMRRGNEEAEDGGWY